MERWIMGISLLKRWGALPFELAALIRSGELVPVSETDGSRRTKDSEPCLCCSVPDNVAAGKEYGYQVECEHGYASGKFYPPTCGDDFKSHRKKQRIEQARFKLSEVEAYEQTHGLGPLPHKPESAEALAETLRAAGITDAGMVARMVKAAIPETSLIEIGALLVDKEDDAAKKKSSNGSATIKRAQRALKSK